MGLTPLSVVGGAADALDRYNAYLVGKLNALSPLLVEHDTWSDALMTEVFGSPWLKSDFAALELTTATPVLTNEVKSYLAAMVLDDRKANKEWFGRRVAVVKYLTEEGGRLLAAFGARCLADVPHPSFPEVLTAETGRRSHNEDVLDLFADWRNAKYTKRRRRQTRTWVRAGEFVSDEFHAPEVQLFGDIHRFAIINREQMRPLAERNVILLNDLYSEEDTRFRDRQRQTDRYLNFLGCQPWVRPLARAFLLDKVSHGELAPATLTAMLGRIKHFCRFLHEDGIASTAQITDQTLERFLAWGNAREAKGKNWYTDIVQLMRAAPILLPGQWPSIALDKRAARRIKYKQAPDDVRNRLYASKEGANRAAPPEAVSQILEHVDELPQPVPTIFMIGIVTGTRAEDLHALLFDCLAPDPHDERFMILTYWQNKVSRWNRKPLLKTDAAHNDIIERIEEQRRIIRKRYGNETKYLFPVFYGKRESFLGHSWTLNALKGLCVRYSITDGDGRPFDFTWHPLRHHRGTQMAAEGHDILSIMFELGHASPDMATMYVNKRLELRKNALLSKGGGKFYTIEGKVDAVVGDLLVRKESLVATRVSGGACTLPGQLGEWCEHANACLTCRFFRADGEDLDHFRCTKGKIYKTIEELEDEALAYEKNGQNRMAELTRKRIKRNKDAAQNTDNIIRSIEGDGEYRGTEQRYRPAPAIQGVLL